MEKLKYCLNFLADHQNFSTDHQWSVDHSLATAKKEALQGMSSRIANKLRDYAIDCLNWLSGRRKEVLWAFAITALVTTVRICNKKARRRREHLMMAGEDIVVLHGFRRGLFKPSALPSFVKLEMYLKLAKIPYMLDYEEPIGPKGLSPWITLHGQDISGSQLVIEELGRLFDKSFVGRLTPEERAVARAFDLMIMEHWTWGYSVWSYPIDGAPWLAECSPDMYFVERLLTSWMPFVVTILIKVRGFSRQTHQELEDMVKKDMASVSDYLGSKPYLMGDEPCEADCTLFGYIYDILWTYQPSSFHQMVKDYPTLVAHQQRMTELLVSNWHESNQIITEYIERKKAWKEVDKVLSGILQ